MALFLISYTSYRSMLFCSWARVRQEINKLMLYDGSQLHFRVKWQEQFSFGGNTLILMSAVESHMLKVIPLVLVCHCSIFLSLINLFMLSSAEYSLLNHGGEDSTKRS